MDGEIVIDNDDSNYDIITIVDHERWDHNR